jgi:hypothetical protein
MKILTLIEMNSIILDMGVREGGKRGLLVGRTKGKTSEFFRGFKLRDKHGKDEFGSKNNPHKPNPFLGCSCSLDQDKIEVKDPGSPGIEKHQVSLLPGVI